MISSFVLVLLAITNLFCTNNIGIYFIVPMILIIGIGKLIEITRYENYLKNKRY